MYWVLDSERVTDDEGGFLQIDDILRLPEVSQDDWALGHLLHLSLPSSLVLPSRPHNGYHGPPPDFHNSRLCLMSKKMVGALRRCGVDNLETYPVGIVNEATSESWHYVIVNVIGLLAAADMEKSEWEPCQDPLRGETEFSSLVVDERKCLGLPIFRLAQHRETILVSDEVRSSLLKADLQGLTFGDVSGTAAV